MAGRLESLDLKQKLDKEAYREQLDAFQERMLHVQQAYYHDKRRALLVFEGWDAAGKGGAIRTLTEPLDPRGFEVHPIAAPRPDEQGRHYLYRFWTKLPEPGNIAIFDRSWYGRVLVERVEGFTEEAAWRRAYDEINQFEAMLAADGARIVKLFLHISPKEQLKRFRKRLLDPYKRWKFTADDIRNRERWPLYEAALEEMFDRTDTAAAPWHAVPANDKRFARIEILRIVTDLLARGVSLDPPPIDPILQKAAADELGLDFEEVRSPS